MTEQEAKRLEAIERVLTASINRLEAGGASVVDNNLQELFAAYDEGVKAGEAKGGYRAGFEAGQASANKTIAKSLASVIALREIVDQCRAAGFIDDAGNVRKVLGTLPVTKDDVIVGDCSEVFINDLGDISALRLDKCGATEEVGCDSAFWPIEECFSTREAAEAARKAVKP